MASLEQKNIESAKRMIELYNLGSSDWVEQSHAKDCKWEELPTEYHKVGRKGGLEALKEAADLMWLAIPDRKMKILNFIANGDQVALELKWTGTLLMTESDSLKAGDFLRFRIAMFLKYRDGKVIKQVDYIVRI